MNEVLDALLMVFSLETTAMILMGVLAGIIIGALPGLTVNMGIALLLPLTYSFQGMTGILMLLGVYCGAVYGGSITAILISTPGTPASAATVLDGYPMAKRGEAGRALGLSTGASMFGGVFSTIALVLIAPLLAKVATGFSSAEYFALAVFGISIITSVSSQSIIKGLMGGALGLFIATIGLDPMTAGMRFTFDSVYLMGGISFIPVLVGLFAFSQGLISLEEDHRERVAGVVHKMQSKIQRILPTWKDLKRVMPVYIRSSVIGTGIGAVPGTGGDIASFIAYNEAKRWSKHPEEFGHGSPEGVSAPEAGANSVAGGAMVPLMTLGIPGDGATAIIMGAFMVQGLALGPQLFTEHPVEVNAIFIGLFAANIFMGIMGFMGMRLFAKVMNVPRRVLVPIIFVLCSVGAYSVNHDMTDVFVMMVSGLAAYILIKLDFSMSPIVIGIILGPMAESNFRRALVMSEGDPSVFLTRPVCAVFLVIALITLLMPIFGPRLKAMWRKQPG
ncbi:tripartite tricarboxylate transporter permease [Atlantibacter subterraneus]|uniref:C4-dicarboxylate ABC transporter permease n=1 Tax=Atlantibacter subterraneus TaxID=255519 RepID=A0A3R9F006_9ENTR|nr:tripartite tricarboxylate transporter permease [Atlantibacter subterranea]MDZ5666349.1 tripartite tricarboxylate transporter permease [Atlantibacter hermannii]QFH68326.1 C4-dicarboxylate ABC transporter permease [Enterobacter sp. E76]MDA3133808.1 tripartite tricarboxylate transporter permease [Atlantibacter subterranea]MDV7023357.1 tripartite tricarboxylate transporter permease [Atlantibacter subterranea]MDW2744202.1 tripartite tricarboxylate transporter permease [Atlantibacter subterranea]